MTDEIDSSDPSKDLFYALRDAQRCAFAFATAAPGDTDWIHAMFRNLSATVHVIEVYMMSVKSRTKEGSNGKV